MRRELEVPSHVAGRKYMERAALGPRAYKLGGIEGLIDLGGGARARAQSEGYDGARPILTLHAHHGAGGVRGGVPRLSDKALGN